MAMALQDLDLVTVGILHEEETSDQAVAFLEFLDIVGGDAQRFDARVLGVEIVDAYADMTVAGAVRVRLGSTLVERQLDFEIVLRVAEIDQGEVGEIELLGDVQSDRVAPTVRPFSVPTASR